MVVHCDILCDVVTKYIAMNALPQCNKNEESQGTKSSLRRSSIPLDQKKGSVRGCVMKFMAHAAKGGSLTGMTPDNDGGARNKDATLLPMNAA